MLLLSAIPLSTLTVSAETYSGTCGDNLTWNLVTETGTLTISGTGEMTDWYNQASTPWYTYNDYINSIIINDGVTNIARSSFWNCDQLTSVTIPTSIVDICDYAFECCDSLIEIAIPNGVENIRIRAFASCTNLKSIILSDTVKYIEQNAFYNCTSLTSIKIPKNVMYIEKLAFNCCDKLESLTVDSQNPFYHSSGNCIIETSSKTVVFGCKNSSIPNEETVTSIGDYTFTDCIGLTSIIIPDNVLSIGISAFSGCSNLSTVEISNNTSKIDDYAFSACGKLTTITIPKSVVSIGDFAFQGCTGLISIDLSNGIKSIGDSVFMGCENLISITIPKGITNISYRAFYGCSRLNAVIIPDSVTSIDAYAFYECSSLSTITISNNIKYIGNYAFSNCIRLTSIILPNAIETIGSYTFENCSMLISVTIPDSVSDISYYTFKDCSILSSVTIPESVTYIKDSAFYNCDCVTLIVKENSVAHSYAIANNIPFAFIGQACGHTDIELRNNISVSCTVDGYSGDIYCSNCDELLKSGELIFAIGSHSYNLLTQKMSDCEQNGYIIRSCSECNEIDIETIEATGHKNSFSHITSGTYTEPKKRIEVCDTCGKITEIPLGVALADFNCDGIIDKTDYYEIKNNISALDTSVFDFDNNGEVDDRFDSIIINHLTNNTPFAEIIDVNGDGESDIRDLVRAKKILLDTTEDIADTEETENNPVDRNLDGKEDAADILFAKKFLLLVDSSLYTK